MKLQNRVKLDVRFLSGRWEAPEVFAFQVKAYNIGQKGQPVTIPVVALGPDSSKIEYQLEDVADGDFVRLLGSLQLRNGALSVVASKIEVPTTLDDAKFHYYT